MARRSAPLLSLGLLLLLAPGARAEEEIPWIRSLTAAFARAAELQKPLMIAINSERVDGGRVEPAAKELRDVTYRDPRVVAAAKDFVCAYLTSEGSSDDFGELRLRYGIEGQIVSPQHVFARADGSLISRREYWPYGYGEKAVEALLDLMAKALQRSRAPAPAPGQPGVEPAEAGPAAPVGPAPGEGPTRAAWIAEQIAAVGRRDPALRQAALLALVRADRDGDCLDPLLALAATIRDVEVLTEIVRALGRPGLVRAAPALAGYLDHDNERVRANAAVSLEYVGATDSVKELLKHVGRERLNSVLSHGWRALGRCGAGDAKVRARLLKAAEDGQPGAAYGPIVGLAYFEKDAKAARAVEKILAKMGPTGVGRGFNWERAFQRGLLVWCLTEIADEKSAAFIEEELVRPLRHTQGEWVAGLVAFYDAAAAVCRGDETARAGVEAGIRFYLGRMGGNPLRDAARRDRDGSGFTPKGEWEVQG